METKHTPTTHVIFFDDSNDVTPTKWTFHGATGNVDEHIKLTNEITGNNVDFKYVPVEIAASAPDLLAERDKLKEENAKLKAQLSVADTAWGIEKKMRESIEEELAIEKHDGRFSDLTNQLIQLKEINKELLEALKSLMQVYKDKGSLLQFDVAIARNAISKAESC